MTWIPTLLTALGIYLMAGLAVGILFVARGVNRVDPAAARSALGFRLLILPGCAALWPLLLTKWLRVARRAS